MTGRGYADIATIKVVQRVQALETELDHLRRDMADTQQAADDASDEVDRLELKVDSLDDPEACGCENVVEELRAEVRYLMQRMDRLEMDQQARSAAS